MAAAITIGALSKATATNIETIRYYERIGLLPAPARTAGNYRAYARDHADRLRFIRRARALGFAIEAVRELLQLSDRKRRDCVAVSPVVRKHLAEVERKLADLSLLRRELKGLVAQCEQGAITDCRVIAALSAGQGDPLPSPAER